MIPFVYWALTAGLLAAGVIALRARLFALAVVAAALCWDNLVIAAGAAAARQSSQGRPVPADERQRT
ncbi:hypothetical protein [Paractinoplanes durhamensis]|uniref:hypothetical protein n=1 Tax=Paractinoplanes durhamensis TaxID=113563 RepID=UPI0019411DA6|nr:hypothetical protein [Actinoplanes durhamensis]